LGIVEDIQVLKPYFFPSVPRLLNRVVAGVRAKLELPGLKGKLAQKAITDKTANLQDGQYSHWLWDNLIFPKVRAAMGGNLGLVVSGAAPIAGETLTFIRAAFRTAALEGYGATETCATATCSLHMDNKESSIGPVATCCEIRLREIPEMNYNCTGILKRGELLIRGPNVFKGYYLDEAKTAEALDKDGWYHTGDVASIDAAGRVRIIDRVKNIYKLGQGEYVAPEKLETSLLNAVPFIASLFIHGDSVRNHLVAIVVVEPERFAALSSNITGNKIAPTDLKALQEACNNPKVNQFVVDEVERASRGLKFAGFEVPRQVHLVVEPFAGDLVTPTLKVKRNVAALHFKKEIDRMYSSYKEVNTKGAGDIASKL